MLILLFLVAMASMTCDFPGVLAFNRSLHDWVLLVPCAMGARLFEVARIFVDRGVVGDSKCSMSTLLGRSGAGKHKSWMIPFVHNVSCHVQCLKISCCWLELVLKGLTYQQKSWRRDIEPRSSLLPHPQYEVHLRWFLHHGQRASEASNAS